MSERFTGCRAPGLPGGWADRGRLTREESIANYRAHFERQAKAAAAALAVPDALLVVETYVGILAERDKQVVPPTGPPCGNCGLVHTSPWRVDPLSCGCTDCLVGCSRPATAEEATEA